MIASGNYEEGAGTKRALMLGAAVLVCTPMVVTLLLLLAVVWPKMDAVTQHLPKAVRSTVASGILAIHDGAATPLQVQRAGRLDAETAARYRPPVLGLLRPPRTPPNMEALYRQQRESKKAAADLVRRAGELEKSGNQCDAEELYTQAAGKDPSGDVYDYTEGMGRSGLRCGDLPDARAGLETAILKEKNLIRGTDEDQLGKVRRDLMSDQQFLIVVYQKEHETALANQACADAHPGATSCTCKLIATGVSCSYTSASK
jgi:hypothetical protein